MAEGAGAGAAGRASVVAVPAATCALSAATGDTPLLVLPSIGAAGPLAVQSLPLGARQAPLISDSAEPVMDMPGTTLSASSLTDSLPSSGERTLSTFTASTCVNLQLATTTLPFNVRSPDDDGERRAASPPDRVRNAMRTTPGLVVTQLAQHDAPSPAVPARAQNDADEEEWAEDDLEDEEEVEEEDLWGGDGDDDCCDPRQYTDDVHMAGGVEGLVPTQSLTTCTLHRGELLECVPLLQLPLGLCPCCLRSFSQHQEAPQDFYRVRRYVLAMEDRRRQEVHTSTDAPLLSALPDNATPLRMQARVPGPGPNTIDQRTWGMCMRICTSSYNIYLHICILVFCRVKSSSSVNQLSAVHGMLGYRHLHI